MGRTILLGFAAGLLAVLVFHQGTAVLLHLLTTKAHVAAGVFGRVPFPYRTAPVPPFGVPAAASAAFWGGVWGILLVVLPRAFCSTSCSARWRWRSWPSRWSPI